MFQEWKNKKMDIFEVQERLNENILPEGKLTFTVFLRYHMHEHAFYIIRRDSIDRFIFSVQT